MEYPKFEPTTDTEEQTFESVVTYLMSFPSGFRFEPLDHELIEDYLKPRINGQPLPPNLMHVVNLYHYNPEYLAATYKAQGEKNWYFFTSRDRKYLNGDRPDRKAGDGYWKATGADRDIMYNNEKVGHRKALVFYKGKPPKGDKTPWIMHEFRILDPPKDSTRKRKFTSNGKKDMRLDDHVLCRIYKKEGDSSKGQYQLKHEVEEGVELTQTREAEMSCIDSLPQPNNKLPNIYNENAIPTVSNSDGANDNDSDFLYNYVKNNIYNDSNYPLCLDLDQKPLPYHLYYDFEQKPLPLSTTDSVAPSDNVDNFYSFSVVASSNDIL